MHWRQLRIQANDKYAVRNTVLAWGGERFGSFSHAPISQLLAKGSANLLACVRWDVFSAFFL